MIGIFDSGVGGLTVAGAFTRLLPNETIVYLGDTARLPYGNKSPDVVQRYAERCADFLLAQNIKMLIIACNTASAFALDALRARCSVPVIGVIEPGADAAVAASKNGRIAVIGTSGTIASGAYRAAILARRPEAVVTERACPLFVPLAEEGWTEHEATALVARDYLHEVKAAKPDVLVLGCTHYPVLAKAIQREVGDGVRLCDSAETVSLAAQKLLQERGLLAAEKGSAREKAEHCFFLTDAQSHFSTVATRFFGAPIAELQRVDL